jgi:hypothetical protein
LKHLICFSIFELAYEVELFQNGREEDYQFILSKQKDYL